MWAALAPLFIKLILEILSRWENRKLHRLEEEKAQAQMEAKIARQEQMIEAMHRQLAISQKQMELDIAKTTTLSERKAAERAAKLSVEGMNHAEVLDYLRRQGLLK